jgi:hypothetical protein
MAHWKRLTGTDGDQIDVNMDAVAYLQEFKDHTSIHFVAGLIAEGKAMIVGVKEKPDTIHQLKNKISRSMNGYSGSNTMGHDVTHAIAPRGSLLQGGR